MTKQQKPSGSDAIPITIGITGHRDLREEDIPELEKQVRSILDELIVKYPDTPLLVLSPLAEGADRLVARIALEENDKQRPRAQLFVTLPLPISEYEKDFEHKDANNKTDERRTKESKSEFHTLIAKATKCLELPLMDGNTPENIQQYGESRDRQYAQVGAYIVRHSQILIALWDADESGLEGATAHIVKFKLKGVPAPYAPAHNPLDVVDTGPVYHILTPRVKNPSPQGEILALKKIFPTDQEPEEIAKRSFERMLDRLNTFNRDANRLTPRLKKKIARNKSVLIPDAKAPRLSETPRVLLEMYAVADTLAIYFRARRRCTWIALFTIAVLAVVIFEIYAHVLTQPLILILYPLALGSALSIYKWAKCRDYQNKHLDYRALAEGLRVQLFWHFAGLEDEVADHYRRKHRTELEWIRNAIRVCNVAASFTREKTASPPGEKQSHTELFEEFVLLHWVEDQQNFFSGATKRDRKNLARHERIAKSLFVFGMMLAIAVFCLHFSEFHESESYTHLHHWLIVIMGAAPAIAAAMGGYAEKMAFSAQAKRYQWMSALFTRATAQLKGLLDQNNLSAAQELIRELGKEALEEEGDWVMTHRERPMEIPQG